MASKDKLVEICLTEFGKRVMYSRSLYKKYIYLNKEYNEFISKVGILINKEVQEVLKNNKELTLEKLDSYINGKSQTPSKYHQNIVIETQAKLGELINGTSFKFPIINMIEIRKMPLGLSEIIKHNKLYSNNIKYLFKTGYKEL